MKALVAKLWNGEPVFLLTFLATIVPLVTSGAVAFGLWHPTVDQLAWTNGVPAVVAAALGVTVTRAKVTPSS